jgi:hypothetical protein
MAPPRTARLAVAATLALSLLGCGPTARKSNGETFPPAEGGLVRMPTARGAQLAPPTSVVIEPSGGRLESADGALAIAVPPGALAERTEFTVAPIANTARGAIGPAFRLGPEGRTFSTPITLTFRAPEKYPTGVSIAGVGVEYQDARGFWHRVENVTRDAAARTVSVTTDHFSDWALTWQMGTAAAEGPIQLTQTVGVPFTAFGRATVFLQGDDATDTSYLLTGTLTVPSQIAIGDETCEPDQVTKTLPPNIAELHKSSPPVFRWGINVAWNLRCTAPGGAVTTRLVPTLFDTMYINLTRCGGFYEPGQIADPAHLKGAYTSNCGAEGLVSASWDLRACVAGVRCEMPTACREGVTVCTDGVQSCVDAGVSPNGTVCGPTPTLVCSEAQCVDLNDQQVGFTVLPTTGLTTTEAGGAATFEVVLNEQPTTTVTIDLAASSAEGSVTPTRLTFAPETWDVPQTVTVTGRDDFVVDGSRTFTVVTSPAVAGDPRYAGRDPADVEVTNIDDDIAGVVVDPTGGLVTSEPGGTATFTVALSSEPVADVTIPLASGDLSEATVEPASLVFGASNWRDPQIVTIRGADDLVADGPVAYTVVVAPASSADPLYDGRDGADVAATNSDDDSAGIAVSPTSGIQTTEAGGTATFTVRLTSQPTADVTVPLTTSDLTEAFVSPASVTFTADDWGERTVVVTGLDDDVDDDDVPFAVITGAAMSVDLGYDGRDAEDVQLSNVDGDTVGVTVSTVGGLQTTEGGGGATFTVVLASEPTADVTIALSSSDSAEGAVSPASLLFTASDWDLPRTVTVTGVDDVVVDGPRPWSARTAPAASADPKYDGLDASDVGVTNADDDVVGVSVTPTSGLDTTEAGGAASFTLVLRSRPSADVTIALAASDPTEGSVSPASVTFTPETWDVAHTVTAAGVDDAVDDGPQPWSVLTGAASSADPAYLGFDPADPALTNADDDAAGIVVSAPSGPTSEAGTTATFTISLASQPTSDVTVTLSAGDPTEGAVEPAAITITPDAWSTARTVTVTGVDDLVDDGDVAYTVVTSPASSADPLYEGRDPADVTVTNLDDDAAAVVVSAIGAQTTEAGGSATFTIALATRPVAQVTVALSTSDESEGTVSPPAVVFAADDASPKTVTVTGVDDLVDDGDVAYTIVTGAASSADPRYAGLAVDDVPVTNRDDDAASILVGPPTGASTSELGTSVQFTVVLTSRPLANVTVPVSSSEPDEGVPSTGLLTFTPDDWDLAQTVVVTGADDAVDDGDRPFDVVLGPSASADPAYAGIGLPVFTFTNADDDAAAVLVSAIGAPTTEAGGEATFTIALATPPLAEVTILVASGDEGEGAVSPATVVFAAGDASPKTVTVTGVDDLVDDGDVTFSIVTSAASSPDPGYDGLAVDDVLVTNRDDDTASIAIVPPPEGSSTGEDGASAQFSVALTSEPLGVVTIPVSSGDPAEATVSPALLTFGPEDWQLAQTVVVTGVNDDDPDGDRPFDVLIGPATSGDPAYDGMDPADLALTNVDDDQPVALGP